MGTTRIDESILTFSTISAPTGFVLNPNGTVTLPAGVLPGSYYLHFTLCQAGSTLNCIEDLELEIAVYPTVRAEPDVFYFETNGLYVNSSNGSSQNILDNDGYSLDCGLLMPNSFNQVLLNSDVIISSIDQTGLAGNFSILNNGAVISINNDIPPGTYNYTYKICDATYQDVCSDSYGWFTVIGYARNANIDLKDNLKSNLVNIYPNPSSGLFTISFINKVNEGDIKVISTLGQILFNDSIKQTKESIIDLSHLSNGAYVIQIVLNEVILNKIIIKN